MRPCDLVDSYGTVPEAVDAILERFHAEAHFLPQLVIGVCNRCHALVMRDLSDKHLALVQYGDGKIERFHVTYVVDDDGRYLSTAVERLFDWPAETKPLHERSDF